jgi:hypothetical protein
MPDFEQLGAFYLGRLFDLRTQKTQPELLLYDAKDLTTHAVCVGMTGSGKTGLCLALLEEAAIDGIPAIAIDPKGDISNLLLAFPELRPSDFEPWIDPAEAQRRGVSPAELAAGTAQTWRKGLADWGQDGSRIARFQQAADRAIYTPGSSAGLPLTVLRSFAAPAATVLQDADALRERVSTATAGLLSLLAIAGDPLQSREHILIASLLERAWRDGRDLDVGGLIREIQSPPFDKVGVLDIESFFPAGQRFELATRLNNLLASPGFAGWLDGAPLDVQRLLYTADGRPRLAILSIAHLSDAERMFFVTILLNEVIGWMRAQSGTSSLRALLYMDEVFGYFPPTANPPSKTPMLTLLKQARAYGLGVVLATQNPVDLDYKGLANAGTWFIGRLQTERDKARVLDGLEGASTAAGAEFDRRSTEAAISGLGNRVFLMNNVHEDHPVAFQTRWALSYLRGPLTRDQIAALMKDHKSAGGAPAPAKTGGSEQQPSKTVTSQGRPLLPPGITETFIAARHRPSSGEKLVYRPGVLANARIHYVHAASGVDVWESLALLAEMDEESGNQPWESAHVSRDKEADTDSEPEADAGFDSLPTSLTRPKTYSELTKTLKDHLYRTQRLKLLRSPTTKQFSQPGESEGDFRIRITQAAHELRDKQVEQLRSKYAPKLSSLQERVRKAEQRVEKERSQASQQTFQTVLSVGASVLGALFGRKLASSANVTRATSSVRAAGRIARQREDVGQAEETVEALRQQLADLEAAFNAEAEKVRETTSADQLVLDPLEIQPRKSDVNVQGVVLAWAPWQVATDGSAKQLFD